MKKLLEFFGVRQKDMCGIDLSSTTIQLLQLRKKGADILVDKYVKSDLPVGCVTNKKILNRNSVISSIKAIVAKAQLCHNNVCIAIPHELVISRVIHTNNDISDSDLENTVLLDVDRNIPFPLEEVSIDYDVIGVGDKKEILIVACKTNDLMEQVNLFKEAGLNVEIVDVDSFAVKRAFDLLAEDLGQYSTIGFVEVKDATLALHIFSAAKVLYSNEQEINLELGVVKQISRLYQMFLSTNESENVQRFVLIHDVELAKQIEAMLGIPVIIRNPLSKLKWLAFDEQAQSLLMKCCGLGLLNVQDIYNG